MTTRGQLLLQALYGAAAEGLEPNVRRWARFVGWQPGDVIEAQILKAPIAPGKEANFFAFADSPDMLVDRLAQADTNAGAPGIYCILNAPSPTMAAERGIGPWQLMTRGTTDKDIAFRRAVYIDFDVARLPGTSATEEQVLACAEVAAQVYVDLVQVVGGEEPIGVGMSGNGCAILLALDRILETPGLAPIVRDFLVTTKALYETPEIKVDLKVSDAKRLLPAFGTVKRKGPPDDPLRPHRRTSFLCADSVRRLTQQDLVAALARLRERLPEPLQRSTAEDLQYREIVEPTNATLDANIAEVRKKLVGLRKMKAAGVYPQDKLHYDILTTVLEGTALAPLGDRSNTVNRAVSVMAYQIDSWEILSEIIRPSIAAMPIDPSEPQRDANHWMRVAEASFRRAIAAAEQHAVERARKEAENAQLSGLLISMAPPPEATSGQSFTAMMGAYQAAAQAAAQVSTTSSPPPPVDNSWQDHYIKSADGKIKECSFNVYLTLANSPTFKNTIRFNLVKKDIEVQTGPFADVASDVLPARIMLWLHKFCRLELKQHEVESMITVVAHENAYDPIADYLNGLVWDGVPRLKDLFFKYAKARTKSKTGKDLTQHLQRVAVMFLVSAVARQLPPPNPGMSGGPGCQVDSMLILEGANEGEGKTALCRILFGDYYVDMPRDLGEKDAMLLPASYWGVEFGELSAMSRTDDRMLKNFLTKRVDKFRPPYARRYVSCPRRCVFIGTTNDEEWNSPSKGRRRYWPVYVELLDLEALTRDRDQLWAEAVHLYRAGERWYLTKDEREDADAEAEARMGETFIQNKIEHKWFDKPAGRRQTHLSLIDVVENFLDIKSSDRVPRALIVEIANAMKRIGFTRESIEVNGRNVMVWKPSEALAGKPGNPSFLRLVKTPEDGLEAIANAKATVDNKEGG